MGTPGSAEGAGVRADHLAGGSLHAPASHNRLQQGVAESTVYSGSVEDAGKVWTKPFQSRQGNIGTIPQNRFGSLAHGDRQRNEVLLRIGIAVLNQHEQEVRPGVGQLNDLREA